MTARELIFVYNANSDPWSSAIDYMHKVFSPSTYPCSLCGLTHYNAGMTSAWKNFINQLDLPKQFLYKDEFILQYPAFKHHPLPAIYLMQHSSLNLMLSAEAPNGFSSVSDLTRSISGKLAAL